MNVWHDRLHAPPRSSLSARFQMMLLTSER
jgi:hypothetical protein